MSVAKKIGQHFIWRGIFLASTFVINLLMARILEAGDSGHFYLLLNWLSLFILVAGFSMESAMVYYGSSGQISHNKMMTLTLLWALVVFALTIALSYILNLAVDSFEERLIYCSYPFAFILINNVSGIFQSQHNFRTHNFILAFVNIAFIAYLAVTLITLTSELSITNPAQNALPAIKLVLLRSVAVKLYFIVTLLQAIVLAINIWPYLPIKKLQLPTAPELKALLRYAALAWGANLLFFFVYRIDYWLIDYYRSETELGNYVQVSKLAQIFIMVPAIIASVIFPSTVVSETGQMRQNLVRASRMLFGCYMTGMIILACTGWFLFPWLYGPSFDQMYLPFLFLIPGILAISIQTLIASWFAGKNRVHYNIYGSIIALVVIVLLNLVLLPLFGIAGAAIASSAGYIAYFIYQYVIFTRESPITLKDFFLINSDDIKWAQAFIRKNSSL